jgi:hypothetical protein
MVPSVLLLQRLAREHHLLIGFESLPATERDVKINVDIKGGRVRDALNAIIAKDPRYEWTMSQTAIEIRPRSQNAGIRRREFMSLPGDATDNSPRFSLNLRQTTARAILNEIAIESGTIFWVFSRYGQHNEFVSIKMS